MELVSVPKSFFSPYFSFLQKSFRLIIKMEIIESTY